MTNPRPHSGGPSASEPGASLSKPSSPAKAGFGSRRLEFIDLLRGWAVLVMIETHVVNATLNKELMESTFFQYLKFINGLVAPSFIFASGLAFAVTSRRKHAEYLSGGPALFKQFRRLLFVLMIGYLLHLPKFNLHKLLYEATASDWQVFFQSDVLHCIAVSLITVLILLILVRTERRLLWTLAGLTLTVLFLTPVMWGIDFSRLLPASIASYLNGLSFSGFPLFPWASFLFAGAVTGYSYLRARDTSAASDGITHEPRVMKQIFLVALAIIALSFLLEPAASSVYSSYDYWRYGPSFTLLRLALVLLLLAGMFFYERRNGVSPSSPITLIGRESLLVYSVHLLLIYGNFGSFNFRKQVDHTYGYLEAAIATIVLSFLMYVLARAWSAVKRGDPRRKRILEYAIGCGLLLVFLFGPGE